jgi:membrane-associated protein
MSHAGRPSALSDAIINWVTDLMSSPWIYLALGAIAAIDAFFPVVPSETLVITAGVFAASTGEPNVFLVIAVAALGAFVGDHISYTIGRQGGSRLRDRSKPGSKVSAAFDWAAKTLELRGGLILVIARYIPGGRTAATLTAGTTRYPLAKFSMFDAIAALSWGIYSTSIGYIGGRAFEEDPFLGLITGLGIAVGITVIVELVRHRLSKRRADAPEPEAAQELT